MPRDVVLGGERRRQALERVAQVRWCRVGHRSAQYVLTRCRWVWAGGAEDEETPTLRARGSPGAQSVAYKNGQLTTVSGTGLSVSSPAVSAAFMSSNDLRRRGVAVSLHVTSIGAQSGV